MSTDNPPETENLIAAAIEAAEEIRDPLDGLVEKTTADPGAPFAPNALEGLAALKKEDRAAFEALRAQLKKAGCRVTLLDKAIAEENGDMRARGPRQADILIELTQSAELFHTPDGTGYADIVVNGHRESWQVKSKGFRRWITKMFFDATQGAPNNEALQAAIGVIEARAAYGSPQREIHIRVGTHEDKVYLDLANETWSVVEISSDGWHMIDSSSSPVRFRRAAGMLPLPTPKRGGSIDALRPFLNLRSDSDFVLVKGWLVAALHDRGPYPVLAIAGEQGSAKSTCSAILRALVDPNSAPLRALPREDRDLFIAATNSHVLTFDNVSGLPPWISDTLCRLSTGGGFAARQLYSDGDEVLFDAMRPIILNGIEDIVTRPDLADRSIFLTLEQIPDDQRREENELWPAFEKVRPAVLGALLDAVAHGSSRRPYVKLTTLPRMADFAVWGVACQAEANPVISFEAAYAGNRAEAITNVIAADPVASSIRTLLEERTMWTGNCTDLLGALSNIAGDRGSKSKTWPATPNVLSGRLRRAASFLRKAGIQIEWSAGHSHGRIITISRAERPAISSSASSQSSAEKENLSLLNDLHRYGPRDDRGTISPHEDERGGSLSRDPPQAAISIPLKNKAEDREDDRDARISSYSGSQKEGAGEDADEEASWMA